MNRIQKQELEIIKIMIRQAKEQNNKSIAEQVGRRLMNLHRLLNKADQQKLVIWAADNLKI
jgi:phosphoglycerate dehydrogenase-like enzyme